MIENNIKEKLLIAAETTGSVTLSEIASPCQPVPIVKTT